MPAIRGVAHATASAATSCTVDVSGIGAQPGDVMVAYIGVTTNVAVSATAVANLTWPRISTQLANGAGLSATKFAHRVSYVAGREPNTWTWNTGATATNWSITIVCFAGSVDFFAKSSDKVATVAGLTVNAPTMINTSCAGLIVIVGWASASNSTFSGPPAGYTIEDQINNASGISVAIAVAEVTAPFPAGTGTLSVTTSNAEIGRASCRERV